MIRGVAFALLIMGANHAFAAPTFQSCANGVTARPADYESYRCYFEVAGGSGEWQQAASHLEQQAAAHPEIDWIVFVRALVTANVDKKAAEPLYVEAARRFEKANNVRGEMLARSNLQVMFYESGRIASAAREVERVAELGTRAQDPELRVRAKLVEAQFLISTSTDLERAYRALQQAETELDNKPTYWLRQHVLHDLGRVLVLTGEYDRAIEYFRRLQTEAAAQQDLSTEARAHLDVINTLLEKRGEEPDAVDVERLVADAGAALATARRAQNLDLELDALRMLGEATLKERPQHARGYIDACVSRAQANKRSQSLSQCLSIKARLLADEQPLAAQQAIDAAIGQLQSDEGADHRLLAYAWRNAMRVAWQIRSTDAAIEMNKQALAAIEHLRDLQPGLDSRAAAFSTWTQDYYWLSGQILRLAEGVNGDLAHARLTAAFEIGERMRARSLLDRLRSPDLARAAEPAAVSSVSLAELQRSLAASEALLSFQIGLQESAIDRFAGGSWLFVVTRDQVRVVALPDRRSLSQSQALFTGLMRQPDAARQRAAGALYDQLFADALSRLPAHVKRLIVVPDYPVESLPLAALGLAERFELVLAPSATIWHDWRTHSLAPRPTSLLVLADPQVDFAAQSLPRARSWTQDAHLSLGALPQARAEGRNIIDGVGGLGSLWIGAAATETALKAEDLSRHSVLHFAAHTVIDGVNADRSAILLASGTAHEDGLLQSREIADLRLDGQLVVLSSCQSATGTHTRGEGVLGLARSFFASGARSVVGSLWPVRDDQARAFFERFYAFLGEGHSVGVAFHETQRELIARGVPAEVWAGFILMGDADVTPVTKVEHAGPRIVLAMLIGALVLAGAFAAIAALRRRSRM